MSVHVTNKVIKKEWTDYNEHLNMAYYVLIFDIAWEVILEKFNMGEHSAKTTKMSTMVVETHTTYNKEVKQGDEVEIVLTYFDHDKKRLHFRLEMYEKNFEGLLQSYVMAIPFFHNTLISTFVYLFVLKLLFDLAIKKKIFKVSF